MLTVTNIDVSRMGKPVLRKVSMTVADGEKVAILGHNGAGKSTLLRAIVGLHSVRSGTISLDDADISRLPPHKIVPRGVALVPQGSGYFANLTVEENLDFGRTPGSKIGQDEVLDLFPILMARQRQLVGTMSGGERQMVSIAMALLSGPNLLLLDEPSIGLAPRVVSEVMQAVEAVHAAYDMSVVLVEQNVAQAASFADRAYVLNQGRVTREGPAIEVLSGDIWELV